jgi:GT2 family glycosyltransferase
MNGSGADPPRAAYDVSAIIVNHNGAALLPRCLAALRDATSSLDVQIVIVDNGSTDGSVDLPSLGDEHTTVLRLGANLGFARSNNLGAAAATGRNWLLLNTDCFLMPNAVEILVSRLEHERSCAVVGPRLINADGTLQPSAHNFPSPLVFFVEQSHLWKALRHVPAVRVSLASPHARSVQVDWLAGACLVLRPGAFREVGGFDERFFMYSEETDLCMRLHKHGYTVMLEPRAQAVHLGGGSSLDPTLVVTFFESLYLFYRLHFSRRRRLALQCIVKALALIRIAQVRLRRRVTADARVWMEVWREVAGL